MTDPRFGEQGGLLTYGAYLRLPDLLDQQVPESVPPAHDELLFITIHQVFELWFKLLLAELTDARDRMMAGEAYLPRVRLARARSVEDVLIKQVDVIDTMTPQDFLAFRNKLAPASGFQSAQFREIEFLSGLRDRPSTPAEAAPGGVHPPSTPAEAAPGGVHRPSTPAEAAPGGVHPPSTPAEAAPGGDQPRFLGRFRGLTDAEQARLRRRLEEPSLWDGYLAVLRHEGFAVGTEEERFAAFAEIARNRARFGPLWDLAEALVDHDQAWSLWRARHVLMAERQIGTKAGTGGSAGGAYLRSRVELRFYPELWELRSRL